MDGERLETHHRIKDFLRKDTVQHLLPYLLGCSNWLVNWLLRTKGEVKIRDHLVPKTLKEEVEWRKLGESTNEMSIFTQG